MKVFPDIIVKLSIKNIIETEHFPSNLKLNRNSLIQYKILILINIHRNIKYEKNRLAHIY